MNNDAFRQDDFGNDLPASDWESLARYLTGESTPEESVRMRRWLMEHPLERALVDQLNVARESELAGVDMEAALVRVHRRMEQGSPARDSTSHRVNSRVGRSVTQPARRRGWMVAGSLLAAAALLVAIMLRPVKPVDRASQAASSHTYTTRTGQRDSIMLSDGTHVILGPDSRLTVPGDYGNPVRAVDLDGDAYFVVRHDATKPFEVRVANALIEDIGTVFLVESDARDTTSVSVLEGSVRLRADRSAASDGAILAAGDRGSLTSGGSIQAYPKSVRSDDAAWTTGRVVLHDASLIRISGELRRWYGVELLLADSSFANRHVTTTFDDSDSVDQVLKSLALALGARIDRTGTSATIFSNRGK